LLAEAGLEPERLEMFFLSSAEGVRFAELATEMTERARQLGPNPLKNGRTPGSPTIQKEQPMEAEE
jgi:F420-non-reducing hydrogenase iron-sulfur subunit